MTYEAWRISYQSSEQAAREAYAECERLRAKIAEMEQQEPVVEMSDDCEHSWMFAGTVYSYKSDPRPDGSVVDRIYEDHYYCTKCLQYRYTNVRKHGHSHTYPIAGSRPK